MEYNDYYIGQVSCIERQISELQARRNALLSGICFTGYYDVRPYLDPYGLSDLELEQISVNIKDIRRNENEKDN